MIDFDLQSYVKKVAPSGDYILRVVGIPELKQTKANNGSRYLQVNVKVVDGPMLGHMMSKNFNLYNASETAERMARESFCSFCEAACVPNIKAYAQLEGATFIGKVIEKYYGEIKTNEIDSFAKFEGTVRVPEEELTAPPTLNDDIPF